MATTGLNLLLNSATAAERSLCGHCKEGKLLRKTKAKAVVLVVLVAHADPSKEALLVSTRSDYKECWLAVVVSS